MLRAREEQLHIRYILTVGHLLIADGPAVINVPQAKQQVDLRLEVLRAVEEQLHTSYISVTYQLHYSLLQQVDL